MKAFSGSDTSLFSQSEFFEAISPTFGKNIAEFGDVRNGLYFVDLGKRNPMTPSFLKSTSTQSITYRAKFWSTEKMRGFFVTTKSGFNFAV